MQLKLFVVNIENGKCIVNKVSDFKMKEVPESCLSINIAEYKPLDAVFHGGTNIKCGHYKTYLRQSG